MHRQGILNYFTYRTRYLWNTHKTVFRFYLKTNVVCLYVHLWITCITWCISAFMRCSHCAFVDKFCGQLHFFHEYTILATLFCAFLRMYYTCIHHSENCLSVSFFYIAFHSVVIVHCIQMYDYHNSCLVLCIQKPGEGAVGSSSPHASHLMHTVHFYLIGIPSEFPIR